MKKNGDGGLFFSMANNLFVCFYFLVFFPVAEWKQNLQTGESEKFRLFRLKKNGEKKSNRISF